MRNKRLENQSKENIKIIGKDKLDFYLNDKKVLNKIVEGLIADLEMLKQNERKNPFRDQS